MLQFLGDIHGNFNYLKELINLYNITDTTIIQVGDFGIGFTSKENDEKLLSDLNSFLTKNNIVLYAIRGNHDNPDYFIGNHILSNLKLMPDYSVITINDYNILLVGGAISIDRVPRMKENLHYLESNVDKEVYWVDEVIKYNEDNKDFIKTLTNIDVLVTHTAPSKCNPNNAFGFHPIVDSFAKRDFKLKNELITERKLLDDMFNDLKKNNDIKYHFYGHFHYSNVESWDNTLHILLNINEFYELR